MLWKVLCLGFPTKRALWARQVGASLEEREPRLVAEITHETAVPKATVFQS